MKYKLLKDQPLAKAGKVITTEDEIAVYLGYYFVKNGLQTLISEGWIEEVQPREWYEVEIIFEGEWTGVGYRYKSEQDARTAITKFACDARFIKVREVLE